MNWSTATSELTFDHDVSVTREQLLRMRSEVDVRPPADVVPVVVRPRRKIEWLEFALCKQLSPEKAMAWFFPVRGRDIGPAVAVCRQCPVIEECLEDAMHDRFARKGVRGGLSERGRERLRRERNAAARRRSA